MAEKRNVQIAQEIGRKVSEFLARESNRESLITVTRTELTPDLKRAIIFISVLPVQHEQEALLFVKRRVTDLRDYLRKETRFGNLPHIEVVIDDGEKNRQRIDDLTRN